MKPRAIAAAAALALTALPGGTLALDPTVYSTPERFWPERYLPAHGGEPAPTGLGFGYGRRSCPGRHLAEASLWIVIANVLALFDIEPVKDEHGHELVPEMRFTQAITR